MVALVELADDWTQAEFGGLVGISQQAVSDLIRRGVLLRGQTGGMWLTLYCAHLREVAAGREAAGDLDLAEERAALARAQRERIERQEALARKEQAPLAVLEMALANIGRKIAAALESIPVNIKRRFPELTAEAIEIITTEIVKARNIAAAAKLDTGDPDERDSEGDHTWAEDP